MFLFDLFHKPFTALVKVKTEVKIKQPPLAFRPSPLSFHLNSGGEAVETEAACLEVLELLVGSAVWAQKQAESENAAGLLHISHLT